MNHLHICMNFARIESNLLYYEVYNIIYGYFISYLNIFDDKDV